MSFTEIIKTRIFSSICYNIIGDDMKNEEGNKGKLKEIIGSIIVVVLVLLFISWTYGIKVTTNDEGETVCYNIYNKRVSCH